MPRLSWNPSSGIHFLWEPFFVVGLIPCLLFPSTSQEPETHYGASEANRKYSNRLLDQASSPPWTFTGLVLFSLEKHLYANICCWCVFWNTEKNCFDSVFLIVEDVTILLESWEIQSQSYYYIFFFRNMYFTRYSVLQPTCNKRLFSLLIFMKRLLFWKHDIYYRNPTNDLAKHAALHNILRLWSWRSRNGRPWGLSQTESRQG